MLLEQLCLEKIVRNPPCYDRKKLILFQHEFSYNRDGTLLTPLSGVAPNVFSRL